MTPAQLAQFVVEKLEDLKAEDITSLHVTNITTVTDYMTVATGRSKQHVRAIAQNLITESKKAQIDILGSEGMDSGEWVLIDLNGVVTHIMTAETRDYYSLEKLWSVDEDAENNTDTCASN